MFKELRIYNFKSILNEQIFTMEACPESQVSEFPDHIVSKGKTKILKVSSIYGPNGGGKSNLLGAINVIRTLISGNFVSSNWADDNSYIDSVFSKEKASKFDLFFITDQFELCYSLTVDASSLTPNDQNSPFFRNIDVKFLREEFSFRKISQSDYIELFTRNEEGKVKINPELNATFISQDLFLLKTKSFINYVISTFPEQKYEILKPIFDFYSEINSICFLNNKVNDNVKYSELFLKKFNETKNKFISIFNNIDLRIKDIVFKRDFVDNFYIPFIVRMVPGEKDTCLPLYRESSGTKKIFFLLVDILLNDRYRIFLADDFDAFLHPKLINAIINLFNSTDNTTRQLIMNSHDFVNMNPATFRRDEIWFAFRDQYYSTTYLPLTNVVNFDGKMIRKDAIYGKQYLEGRYGADPFIVKGMKWND